MVAKHLWTRDPAPLPSVADASFERMPGPCNNVLYRAASDR